MTGKSGGTQRWGYRPVIFLGARQWEAGEPSGPAVQEGGHFGAVGGRVGEGPHCGRRGRVGRVSCKATEWLGVFQVCFLNIK